MPGWRRPQRPRAGTSAPEQHELGAAVRKLGDAGADAASACPWVVPEDVPANSNDEATCRFRAPERRRPMTGSRSKLARGGDPQHRLDRDAEPTGDLADGQKQPSFGHVLDSAPLGKPSPDARGPVGVADVGETTRTMTFVGTTSLRPSGRSGTRRRICIGGRAGSPSNLRRMSADRRGSYDEVVAAAVGSVRDLSRPADVLASVGHRRSLVVSPWPGLAGRWRTG